MNRIFPPTPKERVWQKGSFWLAVSLTINTTIILLFAFTPLRGLLVTTKDLHKLKEERIRPEALARVAERYEALRSAELLEQLQRYEAALEDVRAAENLRRRSWQANRAQAEAASLESVLIAVGPYAPHPDAPARAEAVLDPAAETDARAAELYRNVRALELSLRGRATLPEAHQIADIPHAALVDLSPDLAAARRAIWSDHTLEPLKASYARASGEMQRLILTAEDFLDSLLTIRDTIKLPTLAEMTMEDGEAVAETDDAEDEGDHEDATDDQGEEDERPSSLRETLANLTPEQMETLVSKITRGEVLDLAPLLESLSGEDSSDAENEKDRRWNIEDGTLQNARVLQRDEQGRELHWRILRNKIINNWQRAGLPARVITPHLDGAARAGIVYVDSWYIVGPFENDGEYDFETLLPPQVRFDLDGRYTGKNGKEVQWTFNQSPHPSVLAYPLATNAIYYFFTEVYFTEPTTTWVAFGSDDGSQFWLNDTLVFQSHRVGHQWRPHEGLRRLHFRKGVNRIFGRVETVPGTSNFSMMIFPTNVQ